MERRNGGTNRGSGQGYSSRPVSTPSGRPGDRLVSAWQQPNQPAAGPSEPTPNWPLTRLRALWTAFQTKAVSLTVKITKPIQPSLKKGRAAVSQRYHRHQQPFTKLGLVVTCVVLLLAAAIPAINAYINHQRYALSDATSQLVGSVNTNLAKKITFDSASNSYYFNKDAIQDDSSKVPSALLNQVGGEGAKDKSLYSVKMDADPNKGITFYDDNFNLSFTLVPELHLIGNSQEDGHIVYANGDGIQDIYSAKGNGIKDDIVLTKSLGDEVSYDYKLNLPKSLQAKAIPDGSGNIGIYSADPVLYNNIQFGDDADKQRVMKARDNGQKTNLVFVLPAPTIKEYNAKTRSAVPVTTDARFILSNDGTRLSVDATGLSKLSYPITVDPSIVTTSSSDFAAGNDEGNIDYSTANQITKGGITGGNIGNLVSGSYSSTWTTAGNTFAHGPVLTGGREGGGSVAYEGYLYIFGGGDGTNKTYDVQCSLLNTSTGAPGAWSTSTNGMIGPTGTANTGRQKFGYALYNGYLYIAAGNTTGNQDDVSYAQLTPGSNCIGAFTQTSALDTTTAATRQSPTLTAYNGYLYMVGGLSGATQLADTQVASINADGTLGTWATSGNTFTTARYGAGSVAYNGYLYVFGGRASGSFLTDVQYAPLAANGTVGAFVTNATSFTTGRFLFAFGVNNGYLYLSGGVISGGGSTITGQFASINANGSVGAWTATSSQFTTSRETPMFAIYNGFMYVLGGEDNNTTPTTWYADTQYGRIDDPGELSGYVDTGKSIAGTAGRSGGAAFAYQGNLYYIGGFTSGAAVATVESIAINSNGTLSGSWANLAAANSLPQGVYTYGFAFYDSYMYVVSGYTGTNTGISTVYYTTFLANGNFSCPTGGSGGTNWCLASNSFNAGASVENHSMAAYNGYLFMSAATGGGNSNAVTVSQINSSTAEPGAWTVETNTTSNSRTKESVLAYNGYLYIIGGFDSAGGTTYYASVEKATITTTNSAALIVGSFSSAGSMNTARDDTDAVILNGYLYAIGGSTTGGGDVSSYEYAPINSNGNLGTWVNGSGLSGTQSGNATAVSGNIIYFVSGDFGGSKVKNTFQANFNLGGSANTGTWNTTSSLASQYATGFAYGQSFAANGYLYIVGGFDGTNAQTGVYSALINTNGTIAAWSSAATHALGTAKYSAGLAIVGNTVYLVAGQTPGGRVASTVYATIGAGGALGTWSTSAYSINVTGTGRSGMGMASYGNYVYLLGGQDNLGRYADVQYALGGSGDFSSNAGCGSAWCNTTSFSTVRSDMAAVAYNGYLYVLGGTAGGSTYYSDVQYAPINGNGTIGSWTTNPVPMMSKKQGLEVFVYDGYIMTIGGSNTVSALVDIQTATILPNGSLDDWQFNGQFTTKRSELTGAVYNGNAYIIGGTATGTFYNDVQYATLNIQPREGTWSKQTDLGSGYNLQSIGYNGTLSGGLAAISVRTATSSGVYGAAVTADTLSSPSTCTVGTTRYVWVSINIDDSSHISFPNTSSNAGNVTDMTLTYGSVHPPPNLRLRTGQYFDNQVAQPLDTCFP